MGKENSWLLLSRLRRAVIKFKLLLNFNIHRWRLTTLVGRSSWNKQRLSFNDRAGLRAVCTEYENMDSDHKDPNSLMESPSLRRTISYPSPSSSEDDDIDKRAEMFINNFRRQLQIERQVSLELRYNRGE